MPKNDYMYGFDDCATSGSAAFDLDNPDVWTEFDAEPAIMPEAPVVNEEVVKPKRLPAAQSLSLTAVIGLAAAAALVVLSLVARVQLTRVSGDCAALESSISALEDEQSKLLIAYESAFNLTEIEDYAMNELGMVKPRNDQIFYISGDTGDKAEILSAGRNLSFADKLGDYLSSFASVFVKAS